MRQEVDDATTAVRSQLDDASFEVAWEEGVKMSLVQAIALALR
jgi:hypothetical protein